MRAYESSDEDLPGRDLEFPDFDDVAVSTRTFTAQTNMDLDIPRIANALEITDYIVVPKRRGRKKAGVVVDPNKDIPYGSIITVDFAGSIRGVNLKCKCASKTKAKNDSDAESTDEDALCSHCRKQRQKKSKKGFRNSFTVVIVFDKPINFKVYINGTFQMTGCKTHAHAEMCVKYIWNAIKHNPKMYTLRTGKHLDALFIPAMRNIDFSLGFRIDRERLHRYITTKTDWYSLLETSIGYTGVNIQIPLQTCISNMRIINVTINNLDEEWAEGHEVGYDTYLNRIDPKDRVAKLTKERDITFLVFQSGKLIMSGTCADFMRPVYYEFLNVIRECYDEIEERLNEPGSNDEDLRAAAYAICAV